MLVTARQRSNRPHQYPVVLLIFCGVAGPDESGRSIGGIRHSWSVKGRDWWAGARVPAGCSSTACATWSPRSPETTRPSPRSVGPRTVVSDERAADRRGHPAHVDAGASETLALLDLGSAALSLELAPAEVRCHRPGQDQDQRGPDSSRVRSSRPSRRALVRRSMTSPPPPRVRRRCPRCRGRDHGRASPPGHRPVRAPRRARSQVRPGCSAASRAGSGHGENGREADASSLIALLGLTIRRRPRSCLPPRDPTRTKPWRPSQRSRSVRQPGRLYPASNRNQRRNEMSSPTLAQKLDRRGHRHRDPRVHRRGLRAAHRVPDRRRGRHGDRWGPLACPPSRSRSPSRSSRRSTPSATSAAATSTRR